MKVLATLAANAAFAGRYQGQSLQNRGIATMTLDEETSQLWNNGAMSTTIGRILNSPFDEFFPLDFIQPHNGPQFVQGETIKFLYNQNFSDHLKMFSHDMEIYGGNSTRFLEDQLGAENVNFDIDLDDLLESSFDGKRTTRLNGHDFEVYHDLSSIEAWLLADVNSHQFATVSSIGKTHENRDIWVVNISNPPANLAADSSLPTVVVDCGIHAREWVSPAFCQHLINELLSTSGSAESWKNSVNWVIYPLLNPDGYSFSWSDDRMWRKNRRVNSGTSCVGVDLNRNYDAKWNTFGSSSNPCHQTYHGTSKFSEPESTAHSNHMATVKSKQAYLTFHSFSEVIIFPYSTVGSDEADNRAELNSLAGEMVSGIKSVHGKNYRKGEGAEIFGLAAGGSDDWAHMSGIPISFTIELRDTGSSGFLLPETQIKPTCEENMKGVEAVFDHVKPLNTCADAACSGDCWYHKSDRLFKCFVPTATTTTRTSTTTTTEPTTSSPTTTTTIPPTTTTTSTTSTEETTTSTRTSTTTTTSTTSTEETTTSTTTSTTTTTTTETSSPTCSPLAATFGLTNGAWECNGNEQDDSCRWICDYGIPTGARAKCLSETNHGDWKEPSAKNKAKADCSLCEEVSADITPENGTWECRNFGVKRICQLNCPDRRRPVFAECIVSRNQGFEINSQLSLEDNTCEAVIGPCDVSLVEENAPDNFKWNGIDYSTIFDFSTTHSNKNIALWGRRKCLSGEGFHHNTQILCKITRKGAKWIYKGNANKKCRND